MQSLMTIKEAAEWLNVPASWIYQRTFRGTSDPIPYIKLGRLLRFEREKLEEWVRAREKPALAQKLDNFSQ